MKMKKKKNMVKNWKTSITVVIWYRRRVKKMVPQNQFILGGLSQSSGYHYRSSVTLMATLRPILV